jgi:hypothetical protein
LIRLAVKAKPEGYGVTYLIWHKKRGEFGVAKRDYKTVSEWKKAYRDKAKLMNERGYRELQPKEFYRAIFLEGSLQSREHDGKGNIIATQIRPSGKGRTKQWVIDDSLDMLDKVRQFLFD